MIKPTDRPVFEGEIASYWFDDGVLVSLSKSPQRTVSNITGNVALVKSITGNKSVPLLIYLSKSPVPTGAGLRPVCFVSICRIGRYFDHGFIQ